MNFSDCPVSMHSMKAISSARATMASAILCRSFLRASPGIAAQAGKASLAARAARSISAALPRETVASGFRSTGEIVSKLSPSSAGTASPLMWFKTPCVRKRAR
ncbi:hypothetical protein D3C87_1853240 [compost metagenome]